MVHAQPTALLSRWYADLTSKKYNSMLGYRLQKLHKVIEKIHSRNHRVSLWIFATTWMYWSWGI